MTYPINITKLNSSIDFCSEVNPLLEEAMKYLNEHPWCEKIYKGWLFTNVGFAVCIFLFEIENIQSSEDNRTWVIVGDFPPMYLDTFNVATTTEVVEVYIELVKDWIRKAENGESLRECYPLDATTDKNSIALLKNKIRLLEENIIPNIEKINFKVALQNRIE